MSRAIDFCREDRVTCRRGDGELVELFGYRYGDLAAVQHPALGIYLLIHLPSGISFSGPEWGSFESVDAACEAMVEISVFKNTWQFLEQSDVEELLPKIKEAIQRHGGIGPVNGRGHSGGFENDKNGYDPS